LQSLASHYTCCFLVAPATLRPGSPNPYCRRLQDGRRHLSGSTQQNHFPVSQAAHSLLESSEHLGVLADLLHVLAFSWIANQLALDCSNSLAKLSLRAANFDNNTKSNLGPTFCLFPEGRQPSGGTPRPRPFTNPTKSRCQSYERPDLKL
jgi:hypothetical protein